VVCKLATIMHSYLPVKVEPTNIGVHFFDRYVRVQGPVRESLHTVEMGNVTADAELTFEYGKKKRKSIKGKGSLS